MIISKHTQPLLHEGLFFTKKILLLILISLGSWLTHGQQFNIGDQDGRALTDSRLMDFLTDMRNNVGKNSAVKVNDVKGSPYFTPNFSSGQIRHKNDLISETLFLRYNAFNDEVEIAISAHQTIAKEALLKRNDIVCVIGEETYLYIPFLNNRKKLTLGYLIPCYVHENVKIFKRKKKNYLEATQPRTSLERTFPPRFIDEIQYFLSLNEGTPFYLGNSVKEAVKSLPQALKEKARAKKIALKKIRDEVSFYSALTQISME